MLKRTKWLVKNGEHAARFSSYSDAMFFAREASRWDGPIGGTHLVEVVEMREGSGIVAQFSDGELTPEFAHVNPAPHGKPWQVQPNID